jgi:peptide/nickel transport system substrate-binding protein
MESPHSGVRESSRESLKGIGQALAVGLALAALMAGVGGCGDSSGDESERVLRGTFASFPDALDPGLSLTAEGLTAMRVTYIPLLTYPPAAGAAGTKLVPGLARSLPRISDGGRAYTLFLRPGLRYSDGTAVRASDFAATIKRLFLLNSPGSSYFTDIVGAEHFIETKKGGIPGIETDDSRGEIVIHLNQPQGPFANELALLFAAPLPADTPIKNLSADPPPATGPYVITRSKPGRGWEYERNPQWARANSEAMPDLPSGHVGRIEMTVVKNASTQVNDVEQGKFDWMQNPPPPDRLPELRQKYEGTQFRAEPTISTFYFWMNTRKAPFDDPRVRQAVNYAVNPAALERIYAGTMKATQQILPPRMPGYEKYEPYPYDPAKARELIAAADPSDRQITVWTNSFHPNDEAGEYYGDVLSKLGFDVRLKIIGVANYFTVIGNQATPDLDTGWSNWLEDYPHPDDYFRPQLSGESIAANGNTNWALIDVPALNAEIARLGQEQLGPKQEAEYAALDKSFMRQAPWAPFGTLTLSTFVSSEIDLDKVIYSPIYGQDLTSFQFK